ncbi:hypothetical protein GF366_02690, partial [Candidatus Peregrinibacteria bacterium]|nr:hypothetical protein [Candidatus Peregrinibacteria bacterium]
MKKLILILQIFIFTTVSTEAAALDTNSWYQYNGYSTLHSFAVKFPPDWQAHTFGDDKQGFAPKNNYDEVYFMIQEFEGETYDQVINYFTNENTEFVAVKDIIIENKNDLVAKTATYQDNTTQDKFRITLIKRGSLIVSLSDPLTEEYGDIVQEIYDSFEFTDNWHQYIDFGEKYTFIFPSSLEITNLSDGVTLTDPGRFNDTVFTVLKYENIPIEESPEAAEGYGENLDETKDILFHGIDKAVSAKYYDAEAKKYLSRLFVEKNGDTSYGMTNVNIETNFPHPSYYDEYIIEILESFEFFDIEGEYYNYKYFPDVRENHKNQEAVNYLKEIDIIAGYPDGTFKPDGEINRAELTKMIVASKTDPDGQIYKNCFPDVKEEWFAPFICYAKENNWVEGYPDGTFKPEQNINRVEALKIIFEVIFDGTDENEELKDTSVADI